MNNFLVGNVIKTYRGDKLPGEVEIVIESSKESITTIPIDATNMRCHHKEKDVKIEHRCECEYGGCTDCYCKKCNGTGYYTSTNYGYDKAKILASNVQEYIVRSLMKNFEI